MLWAMPASFTSKDGKFLRLLMLFLDSSLHDLLLQEAGGAQADPEQLAAGNEPSSEDARPATPIASPGSTGSVMLLAVVPQVQSMAACCQRLHLLAKELVQHI